MTQQELLIEVKQNFNLEWLTVNAFPQFKSYYSHVHMTDLYLETQSTYEEFLAVESLLPDDAKQEYYYMNGRSIAISFKIRRNNITFRILLYCEDFKRVIDEYLQVNCIVEETTYNGLTLSCLKGA